MELETLSINMSDNMLAMKISLDKINPEYKFTTYLDSLITIVESSISTRYSIKDVMLKDFPHLLTDVVLFIKYNDIDIEELSRNTNNAMLDILQIIKTIRINNSNNFYIFAVTNTNIILKVK